MTNFVTPALTAAVSNNGGLGSFPCGWESGEEIQKKIKEIRTLTSKPFAMNVLIPPKKVEYNPDRFIQMRKLMDIHYKKVGVDPPATLQEPPNLLKLFQEQMAVLFEEKVPVISFTFGYLPQEYLKKIKQEQLSILTIGTATNSREARMLQDIGTDAIVAQGSEAGGHRGGFLEPMHDDAASSCSTLVILPTLSHSVHIPLIAAGGIMDGRGIAAAFIMGASAALLGTAFIACPENALPKTYKQALLQSTEESSVVTKIFTGKRARALGTEFITAMRKHEEITTGWGTQVSLTSPMTSAAAKAGNSGCMQLLAGQGIGMLRSDLPVKDLMDKLQQEYKQSLQFVTQ